MKLRFAPARPASLSFALSALIIAAPAAWADDTFKARLSGANEVPDEVATDTSGKFKLQFNKHYTEAEMTLSVNDGVRIQQAHLHCAPVGVNGPIVVFVAGLNSAGYDVDGKWISNATATNTSIVNTACGATLADLAASMRAGNVYVNVHSVAFPGGLIRGQVEPADHD